MSDRKWNREKKIKKSQYINPPPPPPGTIYVYTRLDFPDDFFILFFLFFLFLFNVFPNEFYKHVVCLRTLVSDLRKSGGRGGGGCVWKLSKKHVSK